MLGLIGAIEPILPVQVLILRRSESWLRDQCCARLLKASVITVGVKPETGKSYTVNVLKGTLRRLVIPPGQMWCWTDPNRKRMLVLAARDRADNQGGQRRSWRGDRRTADR